MRLQIATLCTDTREEHFEGSETNRENDQGKRILEMKES